jgi:hypothetical protein
MSEHTQISKAYVLENLSLVRLQHPTMTLSAQWHYWYLVVYSL